jgi:hypothetical protein
MRQKAVVVYAKQRKTAIKAEGKMVTRILTILYFERSPARRNKCLQLRRNDQTAKQVVVKVARTVVVLEGNSCKGDGGWKIGDEIELKIKSTSVVWIPSSAGRKVQNSVTGPMLTRPEECIADRVLEVCNKDGDMLIQKFPSIQTELLSAPLSRSNTVPLRSTSFPPMFNSSDAQQLSCCYSSPEFFEVLQPPSLSSSKLNLTTYVYAKERISLSQV